MKQTLPYYEEIRRNYLFELYSEVSNWTQALGQFTAQNAGSVSLEARQSLLKAHGYMIHAIASLVDYQERLKAEEK
jgi:hypothetical protein